MWFGSRSCGAEVWRVGDKALALVEKTRGLCARASLCYARRFVRHACCDMLDGIWHDGRFPGLRVRLHY